METRFSPRGEKTRRWVVGRCRARHFLGWLENEPNINPSCCQNNKPRSGPASTSVANTRMSISETLELLHNDRFCRARKPTRKITLFPQPAPTKTSFRDRSITTQATIPSSFPNRARLIICPTHLRSSDLQHRLSRRHGRQESRRSPSQGRCSGAGPPRLPCRSGLRRGPATSPLLRGCRVVAVGCGRQPLVYVLGPRKRLRSSRIVQAAATRHRRQSVRSRRVFDNLNKVPVNAMQMFQPNQLSGASAGGCVVVCR